MEDTRTTTVHHRYQIVPEFEGEHGFDFLGDWEKTKSDAFAVAQYRLAQEGVKRVCVYDLMARFGAVQTWSFWKHGNVTTERRQREAS